MKHDTASKAPKTGSKNKREESKVDRRARMKNNELVDQYLAILDAASTVRDLEQLQLEGLQLGRVLKPLGGGRLEIQMMDPSFAEPLRLPIRGCVSGKRKYLRGGFDNSMLIGDTVIISGSHVASKMSAPVSHYVAERLALLGVPVPRGFFTLGELADIAEEAYEFVEEDAENDDAEDDVNIDLI